MAKKPVRDKRQENAPQRDQNLRRKFVAILIATPFAEVGATILLTRWLGAPIAFACYAIPAAIGLVIQWRRYPRIKTISDELKSLSRDEIEKRMKSDTVSALQWRQRWMDHIVFWIVTYLLLVPGVISHLIALYLLIRPPRAKAVGRSFRR